MAENGVAHLLEHMLFKGTDRRTAQAIAEEIEAVGGQMNAYTARENTAYYARVLKGDVPLAVDIIADLLQHSTFDPAELARERSEQRTERFAVGEKVDARVTQFDRRAHKVTVSIKALEVAEEKEAIAQYGSSDSGATLGDILGTALKRATEKKD